MPQESISAPCESADQSRKFCRNARYARCGVSGCELTAPKMKVATPMPSRAASKIITFGESERGEATSLTGSAPLDQSPQIIHDVPAILRRDLRVSRHLRLSVPYLGEQEAVGVRGNGLERRRRHALARLARLISPER